MGPIADRSIVVRIGANVTGFVSSLKTAQRAAEDFGSKASDYISRNEGHINTLANGVGAFGVAAVAAAGIAVKRFADFDQAMSNVAASTMESAGNMELLRSAALDAGQRTAFSAMEAAAAIEELSKAGVSTADVLNGGLDGALDLAAAGGIAVAEAAEIAASAMTQFGLEGRDVTRIADLLAAGAGKAQGGVGDLGQALNQAGLVASQMGLSVEETVGSLTAFASAGLTGSDAGTSFRAMLLRLANPTKESAELMTELGISAYDAQGNFVGMEALAGQLESRLGGLTQETRNQALAQIFGQDAIRTSAILYEQGASGIREWADAVDEQGYAAEVAAERMNNLNGDLEQLSGAIETALINMGEGADGPLRSIVQSLTDVVNGFSEAPDVVQNTTLALVGGGGLVALGVAGLAKLAIGINNTKIAMDALKISGRTASLAVAGVGGAIAVATVGLTAWAAETARVRAQTQMLADTLDEMGGVTDDTKGSLRDMLAESRELAFLNFDSAYDEAEKMGISFETLTEYVLGSADAMAEVNAAGDEFIEGSNTWEHLIQSREGAVANLTYTLDSLKGSLTEAQRAELQKIQADAEAEGSSEALAAATEAQAQAQEAATEALNKWREMVSEADASFIAISTAYQNVIDKNMEIAESTAAATDSSEDSWETYYDGVSVSAADYIAQLEAQVAAQEAWETNILDITRRTREGMTGDMAAAADQMIDELIELGPEGAAQVQLLKDMSDEELARVVTLYSNRGAQAVADFTNAVETARAPTITLDVDTATAQAEFDRFITNNRNRSIRIQSIIDAGGNTGGGYASGGWTGNLPAKAVAGVVHGQEFVVKAGPAAAYRPLLEAINAGVRGYESGGFVAPVTQYVAPARYQVAATPAAPAATGGPAVTIGQMVTANPREAMKELRSELELSLVGRAP